MGMVKNPFRQAAAALLASIWIALGAGCGAQMLPEDGWQITPPGEGPTAEGGIPDPYPGYTEPAYGESTAPSAGTSSPGSQTASTGTSAGTTTATRPAPIAPEDDPQRPKEEENADSGPVVTLPPVTTASSTTTIATTTVSAAPSAAPSTAGTGTAAPTVTTPTSAGTTGTTAAPTTTAPSPPSIQLPSNGIDVSTYQGQIDWKQVKAAGVDFAMIRVGARGYGASGTMFIDARFQDNITGATAAGVDRGVYFFSQAITVEEAKEEARYVLDAIQGYEITYPIAIDFENPPADTARTQVLNSASKKAFNTDLVLAFCDTIREAGYYPIVYTGLWWLNNRMEADRLEGKVDIWLAQYTTAAQPGYSPVTIWQYSSNGSVPGIVGNVDMNRGYVDYAALIRQQGLNHLS